MEDILNNIIQRAIDEGVGTEVWALLLGRLRTQLHTQKVLIEKICKEMDVESPHTLDIAALDTSIDDLDIYVDKILSMSAKILMGAEEPDIQEVAELLNMGTETKH